MATASCDSDAALALPLPHLLALPHHGCISLRQVKLQRRQANAHGFNGQPDSGNWQLATGGGGICGATLVQQKAMANMINWALTLFMRSTPESKSSLSRLSRVSKPSLYSCNALCIFWPCNLKPFLAQRNKVVSCCFARNENANDGNHDQAVGQQKATLCSSFLLLLLLFLGKLDYRALSLVAEKFLEFQCHFYRCEARSF